MALARFVRGLVGTMLDPPRRQRRPRSNVPRQTPPTAQAPRQAYAGDWHTTLPETRWEPHADGRPDPGEIVWAWIPFEEDHTQGKDRPAVLVARHPQQRGMFLALPLTSKDHDRDAEQERRAGRLWMDIGSGPWDRSGRPSEVRLNRVVQLREGDVRREGAALPRPIFVAVLAAARRALES